jgi:hypothetical protein
MIAIDPGVGGGFAKVGHDGTVAVLSMPDTLQDIRDALFEEPWDSAIVEDIPKGSSVIGASALATLHRNLGRIEGVLSARQIPIHRVAPKVWQKALGCGEKANWGKRWKAHLKEMAQDLFPIAGITLKTADALLILRYAQSSRV